MENADLFFLTSAAKMIHAEDKRAFALREREFGRHGCVQDKISCFEEEHNNKGSNVQVEVSVEVDGQQVSREVLRTVR